MEVLLNTIWLLGSIGAFAFWRPGRRAAARLGRRESNILATLALACALLLLFPVISLTDDLHAEQYPMEDSSRSVMKVRNLVQAGVRAVRSAFMIPATETPRPAASLNVIWGTVALLATHPFRPARASSLHGRSPPFAA